MTSHQEGATAVEYGILIALIAAVVIAAVMVLGGQTCEALTAHQRELAENLQGAPAPADC